MQGANPEGTDTMMEAVSQPHCHVSEMGTSRAADVSSRRSG